MSARIRHLALISDNVALAGRFYEAVFGLRTSPESRPEGVLLDVSECSGGG